MAEGHDYRMLEGVDWEALDGQWVEVAVSRNYLQLRTRAGLVVTFGKAKRSKRPGERRGLVEGMGANGEAPGVPEAEREII